MLAVILQDHLAVLFLAEVYLRVGGLVGRRVVAGGLVGGLGLRCRSLALQAKLARDLVRLRVFLGQFRKPQMN